MSTVVEVDPAELDASIVKVTVEEVTVVGVPIISPVDESKNRPAGIDPAVITHKFGAPAVYVGVTPLTGLFLVKVYGEPGYEIADGASSCTSMSTVVEVEPAGLVASIVKVTVEEVTVVGVPIISPVDGSTERPAGIEPAVIVQEVGVPAVYVGVAPVTASFLVNVYGEPGYVIDDGASS